MSIESNNQNKQNFNEMEFTPKVFQCDSKYQNYVEELTSRGWVRDNEEEREKNGERSGTIPANCLFICKNLSKLKFATIFDRHVNHLRGSQHLSNKVHYIFLYVISCMCLLASKSVLCFSIDFNNINYFIM